MDPNKMPFRVFALKGLEPSFLSFVGHIRMKLPTQPTTCSEQPVGLMVITKSESAISANSAAFLPLVVVVHQGTFTREFSAYSTKRAVMSTSVVTIGGRFHLSL